MTQDTIITLHTFYDALEASLAQDKLRENGIESFIENENVTGLNPLGGIELKVFSKDQQEAELIITG